MIQTESMAVPEVFQRDIDRAVSILKEGGCSEIFLFGSGAEGKARDRSDIDLAIRGCPTGRFFHLLGRLLWELEHPVDLVNLDTENPFAQYLQKEGVLLRIG
ncbi:MAG: nucleotidyltransferase domain-containing protein [Deltaproteobacteria bacterium]|nr:nucleotidyltransferase domain-containing protein [Deltaproteobacteria bacterium]